MAGCILKLLRETDYTLDQHTVQDLKWVENIQGMSQFYRWLETINQDNIITSKEQNMYQYLKKMNKLATNDLDEKLNEYMSDEINLDTFDDEAFLEQEIQEKHKKLEQMTRIKETLSLQLKELEADSGAKMTEKLVNDEITKYKESSQICIEKLNILETSFIQLHQTVTSISSGKNQDFIIYQTPAIKQFIEYANVLVKHFKNVKQTYSANVNNAEYNEKSIYIKKCGPIYYKRLIDLEKHLVQTKIEIAGVEAASEYIKIQNDNIDLSVAMPGKESDMQLAIDQACEKKVKNWFQAKQLELADDNYKAHQNMLETLKAFIDLVKPLKLYTDGLIKIFKRERLWIPSNVYLLNDVLKALQELVVDFDSRQAELESNLEENESKTNNTFSSMLKMFFSSMEEKDEIDLTTEVNNVNFNLIKEEKIFLNKINNLINQSNEILSYVNEIDAVLHNGPTKMPLIMPCFTNSLSDIENKLKHFHSQCKMLKNKYENFNASLENNPSQQKILTLWSDYLNNEYGVTEELVELEALVNSIEI